jgi:hypothetical protein
VAVTGLIAVLVLAGGALYAARPGFGRSLVAGIAVLAAVALLTAGVVAAVAGERDFEEHGDDTDDHTEIEDGLSE